MSDTANQAQEWGRAIVQAYMGWYVFFVAGNIAMLGWIHTRRVPKTRKKSMSAFRVIAAALAFLNLGGIVSSGIIMWYLHCLVHQDDRMLFKVILWAGSANTLALIGLLVIWLWILWKKTYEISFPGAKD